VGLLAEMIEAAEVYLLVGEESLKEGRLGEVCSRGHLRGCSWVCLLECLLVCSGELAGGDGLAEFPKAESVTLPTVSAVSPVSRY
jgi:hypothetical protein